MLLVGLYVITATLITGVKTQVITGDQLYQTAKLQGTVNDPRITEASGLAASKYHTGVLYTHNDKGGKNIVYALNSSTAETLAALTISHTTNYDWEDIAVGPCGPQSCIYIAETGDHHEDGAKNIIYRVVEPAIIKDQALSLDAKLQFTWDQPDCETIMIDPNGEIYVVSKVLGGHGTLARVPKRAFGSFTPMKVEASTVLNLDGHKHDPVGGDISPDGKRMLIKYKRHVYYWYVNGGDYINAAKKPPLELPYHQEQQGESVCWDKFGGGYYTLSEGAGQNIYYYKRKDSIIG